MANQKKHMQILFSCLGSSDPVRGSHDGPMLHIARHYHPEKILWILTPEMQTYQQEGHPNYDNRYNKAINSLTEHCPGYVPEILPPLNLDVKDPSDFDAFDETFRSKLEELVKTYPDAEILMNMSSGTTQMQVSMALLAISLEFPIKAVQVKNFQSRSGTSTRTTKREEYDVDYEIQNNEDNKSDSKNRCVEPELISLRREKQREEINELLFRYDYGAIKAKKKQLPVELRPLIEHLYYRSQYDMTKALQKAEYISGKSSNLEIELYPAFNKGQASYSRYRELSEYLLLLQSMQRTGRLTDFVIRLNPFVVQLEEEWLKKSGVSFSKLVLLFKEGEENEKKGLAKIEENYPGLPEILNARFKQVYNGTVNIAFENCISEWKGLSQTDAGQLFKKLESLNKKYRNLAAHKLTNVNEEDISGNIGEGSGRLIKDLRAVLQEVFPQHYDDNLFDVFKNANGLILNLL